MAWALSCGALTLLLCAQLAWASRDLLLSTPLSGAWLRAGCATLHCTLPLVAAFLLGLGLFAAGLGLVGAGWTEIAASQRPVAVPAHLAGTARELAFA